MCLQHRVDARVIQGTFGDVDGVRRQAASNEWCGNGGAEALSGTGTRVILTL